MCVASRQQMILSSWLFRSPEVDIILGTFLPPKPKVVFNTTPNTCTLGILLMKMTKRSTLDEKHALRLSRVVENGACGTLLMAEGESLPKADAIIQQLSEKSFRKQLCISPTNIDCSNYHFKASENADTVMGDAFIAKSDDIMSLTTVDQVCHGYNLIFEKGALFSYTNFLGVPLQQDPLDAFAIMDLIWRLKPDLLIELGTAGGGSAFFYAFIMRMYDPSVHVITIDPKREFDWNRKRVRQVCPHCVNARNTSLWNSDAIHFFNAAPTSSSMIETVHALIRKWGSKRVLVMEDGNHRTDTVLENIRAYADFVSPGSFLIVQDTKMRRLYHDSAIDPSSAIETFLSSPLGADFYVDRTFEYYLCTQHAGGFLRRNISTLEQKRFPRIR